MHGLDCLSRSDRWVTTYRRYVALFHLSLRGVRGRSSPEDEGEGKNRVSFLESEATEESPPSAIPRCAQNDKGCRFYLQWHGQCVMGNV